MSKQSFSVQYDNPEFWLNYVDQENELAQEIVNWTLIDAMAKGYKWSMAVKGRGQRKFHSRSVMANSVYAMLDSVKAELSLDSDAVVVLLTPDFEVVISC